MPCEMPLHCQFKSKRLSTPLPLAHKRLEPLVYRAAMQRQAPIAGKSSAALPPVHIPVTYKLQSACREWEIVILGDVCAQIAVRPAALAAGLADVWMDSFHVLLEQRVGFEAELGVERGGC